MSRTVRIRGQVVHDRGDVDLDVEDVRLADGTRLTEAKAQELAEAERRTPSAVVREALERYLAP